MPDFLRKTSLPELLLWLLFALSVGPLLALALYNHPSPADDYCFAFMTRDHGFWHGQHAYYTGWTGRYFATFLFHATPLWAGWLGYFKVMPFVLVGLLFHALFSLFGEALPATTLRQRAALAAGFVAVYLCRVSSVAEAFFWSTAVYVYLLPAILFLYLITWIARLRQERYRGRQPWVALWAAFLVFAVVGSNEMMMIFTLIVLGAAFGYTLVFRRKFDGWLALLLGVALASAALMLAAPGNAARLGSNPQGGDLPAAIVAAARATISLHSSFLAFASLLVVGIGFGLFLRANPGIRLAAGFRVPWWVLLPVWLGAVVLMYLPQFYGVGTHLTPPPRILNLTVFFFLLGFLYLLAQRDEPEPLPTSPRLRLVGVVSGLILAGYVLAFSPAIRTMYRDLGRGTARRFDQEMTDRYAQIRVSRGDTARVAPLQNVPQSLFVEDVKTDPTFLWNTCAAEYFGKKTVVLDENLRAQP